MILGCIKSREYFHGVDYVSLLLGFLPLGCGPLWRYLLLVEEAPLYHKLIPLDPLILPRPVVFDHALLEFIIILVVITKEFHLCKDFVQIIVILIVKVLPLSLVAELVNKCGDTRVVTNLAPSIPLAV